MTKRTTAIIIEVLPIVSVISALALLMRETDSLFLRTATAVVFLLASLGFVAFFAGRKLAKGDRIVRILGVFDWLATACIIGIYVLGIIVIAIW